MVWSQEWEVKEGCGLRTAPLLSPLSNRQQGKEGLHLGWLKKSVTTPFVARRNGGNTLIVACAIPLSLPWHCRKENTELNVQDRGFRLWSLNSAEKPQNLALCSAWMDSITDVDRPGKAEGADPECAVSLLPPLPETGTP